MEHTSNHTRYKTWALLNDLGKAHSPSDFGRVNQALLAITFQNAGFIVTHYQGTGRPDFVADRLEEGYAIEVKAPVADKVTISKEDITGVEKLGHKPLLAILTYPLLDARWIFIETNKLSPKSYRKSGIERLSISSLEKEIAPVFLNTLQANMEKAIIGSYALQGMVESRE